MKGVNFSTWRLTLIYFICKHMFFSPVFGTRRGPSFVPGSKQNIVVGIFSFIHLMAIMWLPPHREVTSCLAL